MVYNHVAALMSRNTHNSYLFTVVCLVTWSLNENEAGSDLAMIKTSLKSLPKSMNFITWQICFICLIWWQMLQAVSNIAPRGVYVCGNATSTSGLTVRKHWNLCHLVSNNLCCLMETWYSLIRRHKKTVDKIKIGLKGKQTRKFMNFIRTAMAADNRCGKFYRGLAKVTPLFQPFFAWTKICVCPAMMKITQ